MVLTRFHRRALRRRRARDIVVVAVAWVSTSAESLAQAPAGEPATAEAVLRPVVIRPEPPAPRNTVTLQPITLAWSTVDLEYERALGHYLSVYVASAISAGLAFGRGSSPTPFIYGIAGDLGIRFFPLARAPGGLFGGAYVGLTSFYDALGYGSRFHGSGVRAGTNVGYSVIIVRHADLSFALGIEYLQFRTIEPVQVQAVIAPTARVALGIAF